MEDKKEDLAGPGIGDYAELEITGQLDFLEFPYHQAILNHEIPLSIGGGIGQSRTYMQLLRTAHLGEVSVTVWPKILKDMCAKGTSTCLSRHPKGLD